MKYSINFYFGQVKDEDTRELIPTIDVYVKKKYSYGGITTARFTLLKSGELNEVFKYLSDKKFFDIEYEDEHFKGERIFKSMKEMIDYEN